MSPQGPTMPKEILIDADRTVSSKSVPSPLTLLTYPKEMLGAAPKADRRTNRPLGRLSVQLTAGIAAQAERSSVGHAVSL